MIKFVVNKPHLAAVNPRDALVDDHAIHRTARPAGATRQPVDRQPAAEGFENAGALVVVNTHRREAENRLLGVLFVVLLDRVLDRERAAIELARDTPGNFGFAALTHHRQPAGAGKDDVLLGIRHLSEIGAAADLVFVRCEKPLDGRKQKPHAAPAVVEDKPPRRQPPAAPSLDRFAGDVEAQREVVNLQNRLDQGAGSHVQSVGNLFDQQSKIVL